MFARLLTCASLALAPTLVIGAASAQNAPVAPPVPESKAKTYGWYLKGGGGYASEIDYNYNIGSNVQAHASDGIATSAAAGLNLGDGLRVELEYNWHDRNEATSNFGSGRGMSQDIYDANVYWDFGRYQPVNFYIGAGYGYVTSLIEDGRVDTYTYNGTHYQGIVGVEFRLFFENTRLYFEGRYENVSTEIYDIFEDTTELQSFTGRSGLKFMF